MNNAGTPIIGLGERRPEWADLPLQWMPHIQVAEVGTSVERALARGGRAIMHHQDDAGRSQWAVLLDPNGTAFGIIPVVAPEAIPPFSGVGASPTAGSIVRLDLTVADPSTTLSFYREVVGWAVQDIPMEDAEGQYADYALFASDGTAVAGLCHARGANRGLPPVWLICLPVGDLEESLGRVEEGGGQVIELRQGGDGAYVYAVVRDPVGSYLALVPG